MEVSPELIRRLDELVRNNDQSLRDWFFGGLIVFTVVVGAGVFLEFAEHLPIRTTRFNADGWLVVRHGVAQWKKRAEWISTIVVLIGLAGEGLFEGLTSRADNILQTFNEVLVENAQLQASEADERAASAESTAKGFDAKISASNAEAEQANALAKMYESQIADSTARVKEADARAAEARSMAEAERVERLRLQSIVAPRSLSLEQQDHVANLSRAFIGHRVIVLSYGLDLEGAAIGAQIINTLRRVLGHDNVLDGRASFVVSGGFDLGIHLRGPESERAFITALSLALPGLVTGINDQPPRFSTQMGGVPGFPANTPAVTIMIGVKPVPLESVQ